MKSLNILIGVLLAALAMAVAAPGPGIGVVVAQDVRSGRPPALLENGSETTGLVFEGAPLRLRTTRVNAGLLQAVAAGMAPALTLNLFRDVELYAVFERMEEANPGRVWVGHLEGEPMSSVTLAVVDGVLSGHVSHVGGLYEIKADADGTAVVSRLDPTLIREDTPVYLPSTGDWPDPDTAPSPAAAGKTVITVSNFYTAAVRRRAGGHAAIKASLAGNIARANTAFIKSAIKVKLKQVSAQQVSYKETRTGSLVTDVTRLRSQTDRFLKPVHTVRNSKKADLVALIVSQASTNSCSGIAFTSVNGPPRDDLGFSVTEYPLCMSTTVYAHEEAHNMGAQHDWYVSDNTTVYNYGHGYVDVKKKFRTIMAYTDRCAAAGITCERIGLFSNPKKRFKGKKVGVGGSKTTCTAGRTSPSGCAADNARALNNTRSIVAAFR